ncbi:trypsin-like peptidase domain-containing protein [Microcoleus sp. FACHB-1515]|uniref:S1C family serine protease n=1 Tax=Cyanophyceae TaxID=3028117 RepID=UPI001684D4BB|nr:trypsin-like peptidase domain-containing protein [Microcoleus sp. FACHB-1515]MBD2090341.1 trypsin-like peptidase domain-containing protein [Microcoleus sp. FACHB-1515]
MSNTTLSNPINAAIAHLAENLRRSTVQVSTPNGEIGSGIIWRSNGLIITNAHVVSGASAIVQLADGRSFAAQVTQPDDRPGRSRRRWGRDLAALQIEATDLPAAAIASSSNLRVGDLVFAVGHPHGQASVTMGIVHTQSQQPWIQADIRLAPGNSGGPLPDAQGRVVGVNTMIVQGLGFAIPSEAIETFLQNESRPRLGVTLQPVLVSTSGQPRLGLLVLTVESDSPAADSLLVGDVLIGVDGWPLRNVNDFTQTIATKQFGESVQIDLLRGGNRQTQSIELAQPERMQVA